MSSLDLSIIMPARNEHPQATFTLQSMWDQLEDAPFSWETILVDNKSDDKTATYAEERFWGGRGTATGRHRVLRYTTRGSCWGARNMGLAAAEGRITIFFDAHVVVSPDLFVRILSFMDAEPSATICYIPVVWMGDSKRNRAYGYSLGENNSHMRSKFWGSWTKKRLSPDPYLIPMSGTAGMAVRTDWLKPIGWPEPMRIYGGGEQWVSMLCWMTGGSCWIHPDTYVYHLSDTRGYNRKDIIEAEGGFNEAHFFNKALVAYSLGGEKWWKVVVAEIEKKFPPPYTEKGIELAWDAKRAATQSRRLVESIATRTLDEVLEMEPWAQKAVV